MSDEFQDAIQNAFGEPQRAARAASMFHEMRQQDGLEYLNDWSPDELSSKLKSFADGGNIKTGWNKWAAIQGGSGVDTSEYKF
ncbi:MULTISPECIES: hypothetical protein [Haloferacaceae]|uniref:Uncharacterized protein n=1 Tax=Halorubrum glutamatedens TaxID=2707018 RepID=A0ABD5QS35_9EURY|nr:MULTISPECIES: hypothetical protein [Haloferacales]